MNKQGGYEYYIPHIMECLGHDLAKTDFFQGHEWLYIS